MATKRLQIIDYNIKQAGNADTLDGKHSDEFATITDIEELSSQIGDDSVSNQINAAKTELIAKIDEKAKSSQATVLYSNSDGDNTSETIELNDDASNYDMIEIVYGYNTWTAANSAKSIVIDGATKIFPMSVTYVNTNFINITTGMCSINGTSLLRGTALGEDTSYEREKMFVLNWGTSGTLTTKTTVYTASDGFALRIYRVLGYKD